MKLVLKALTRPEKFAKENLLGTDSKFPHFVLLATVLINLIDPSKLFGSDEILEKYQTAIYILAVPGTYLLTAIHAGVKKIVVDWFFGTRVTYGVYLRQSVWTLVPQIVVGGPLTLAMLALCFLLRNSENLGSIITMSTFLSVPITILTLWVGTLMMAEIAEVSRGKALLIELTMPVLTVVMVVVGVTLLMLMR